jgi:hypothetical protein
VDEELRKLKECLKASSMADDEYEEAVTHISKIEYLLEKGEIE